MSMAHYELHDRLERLAAASADQDILVTLAVPPDDSIGEARQPVETDYAEASQLDEQSLPTPLVDSLESVRSALTEYDEIPENGLAIYAGAVDGEQLLTVFDDLPIAIEESIYEHANEFDLSPLEDVTEPDSTYGLLVVERGGAALGWLDETGVEPIDSFDSDVPGKSSAGGQSAERFERDRERQKRDFFDTVAERATLEFVDEGAHAVLLGGTTGTVETFREETDLDHRLEDLLEGEFAVEYATEQGLRQLAETGQQAIDERDRRDARDALEDFFAGVRDDDEAVAYGYDEVDDALEYDAVDRLLLSTGLEEQRLQPLGDRTAEQGGDTVVVPDDFADGERFLEAFDGIAALLRFPID
ncbi:single-stranded DNA-binding protein [Natronolimnobius sp. AArcel1]|uniref:Vms1/Ankzf1 family peptidyl-tRNA hydrolase n=1 Tax=Natronolimnobius sp. AArcel1 TaxID=1679093 RepID=UPI0013EC7BB1|nr:Vms1/Ankzf1 family peptidyl-tRNA hydrolase [Natronolimnobius sp. AArcel1]NGM67970.1 single-stranded DNA-binding protein [Natronolimnobius sp. AArcel1]